MGKYIGIDLGTTFSCMAYINDNGLPEIIPNSEGDAITPSTVLFEDGSTIVGKEAKAQSLFDPQNFEQFVKRHMGERDYFFTTQDGEKYSPEAVSAIILAKMKSDAESYLGDKVDGAVVTVPAYFNEAQRKSTMDAGQIAGLNVIGIINEPTAAALSFGISKGTDKEQTVMVYDLGGGTFDVTVMRFTADNITVLGTAGDRKLGGYDFDNKIIEAVTKAAAEDGINIDADLTARQDLQLKAEAAKKSLSAKDKTNIILNVAGRPFKYTITREDFLDLVEPLLYKTVSSMENACDEAGLEYSDLDKILLVGGSTRMPIVQDFIKEETGITPSSEVHPDEAVAIGAAYHVLDLLKNQQEKAKESGHTEDLAFQEIDSYIAAHPQDDGFKKNVAYDIDSYSNGFFYYDQAHDASFIADKESYQKCLKLCTKAAEIYSDEYTQKRLENAQYYGKKEWDSWNIESIKSLTLYGLLLTAIFFPVGLALLAIDAAVVYFSLRPYWQINKTYVTGEMGGVEKAVTMIGDLAARFGGWFTRFLWNLFVWFIKFIISLCGGLI